MFLSNEDAGSRIKFTKILEEPIPTGTEIFSGINVEMHFTISIQDKIEKESIR